MRRLFGVDAGTPYPKDGINDHVVDGAATVNPALARHEGGALVSRSSSRRGRRAELRLRLRGRRPRPTVGAGFDAVVARAQGEADAFYAPLAAGRTPAPRARGACGRPSPGCCGRSSTTTRRRAAGSTATRPAAAARRSAGTGATRAGSHLHAADVHPDARRLGVPLVRGLGPGLPLRRARAPRPGVGQGAAAAAAARVVHAPARAAARRTSGSSATSTRPCTRWRRCASTRSTARTTTSCSTRIFHKLLINFTWWMNREDDERQQPVRRAASSGSTTSRPFDRDKPLPDSGPARAGRRDGWMAVYASDARHGARARARRTRLRGRRGEVLRALLVDRAGDERAGPVGRGGRLLLQRRPPARRRASSRSARARSTACCRCSRSWSPTTACSTSCPDFARARQWFLRAPPRASSSLAEFTTGGDDGRG